MEEKSEALEHSEQHLFRPMVISISTSKTESTLFHWSPSLGEPLSTADGYYVKSMSSGDVDLLKEKLKVDGSARQSITITLAATP